MSAKKLILKVMKRIEKAKKWTIQDKASEQYHKKLLK